MSTFGNISLGVRLNVNDYKRIDIENCNLEATVDKFKEEITKQIGVEKNSIVLIYAGVNLEDDKPLSSCGIKPGVTIHVLPRPTPKTALINKKFSDSELEQLVHAFKAFMLSPGYRTALQRLSRPEVLETIKAATPGLSEDLVACALIQDPELLVQLSDISTVKTIATHHPSVIDAANYIAAHVHEETATVSSSNRPGTSTGYSYSLEALSDEDNDMESNNEAPREGNPLTRNTSYGAITAAQLADAILNSTQNINFGATPSRSNVITNEMFSNAIQQAIASNTNTGNSFMTGGANAGGATSAGQTQSQNVNGENAENLLVRLQPQLQQMREMGLTNDSVNIRALQVTSGDVQAAVELVFNGVID